KAGSRSRAASDRGPPAALPQVCSDAVTARRWASRVLERLHPIRGAHSRRPVPALASGAHRNTAAAVAAFLDVVQELLVLRVVQQLRGVFLCVAGKREYGRDHRSRLARATDLRKATTARNRAAVDVESTVPRVRRTGYVTVGLGAAGGVRLLLPVRL